MSPRGDAAAPQCVAPPPPSGDTAAPQRVAPPPSRGNAAAPLCVAPPSGDTHRKRSFAAAKRTEREAGLGDAVPAATTSGGLLEVGQARLTWIDRSIDRWSDR